MEKSKTNVILILVTVAVFIVIVLTDIFIVPHILYTKSFDDLVGDTSGGINKIVLFSGSTGKQAEITDKAEIDSVYGLFKDTNYRINWDQNSRDGFQFSIGIYKDDGTVLKGLTYHSKQLIVCDDVNYSIKIAINEEEINKYFPD
ncbi:MAG: hypothetical protein PHH84_00785 [Oscillospiraceae bacterium]|nr:hypothetical protein [Oscillospiraceae bacterium]MDD4414219.1 hypothetical protein [Oscillospiraceae bacterium]